MQLPEELQTAIDQFVQKVPPSVLKKAREALTQTYREGGNSGSIFSDEARRLSYLGARMPATFAAVSKALGQLPVSFRESFSGSLLDLGAGPGTASWAAAELFPSLEKITLIEKSHEAVALGRELSSYCSHPALREAEWIHRSIEEPIPASDMAILSYVVNELKNPEKTIASCWKEVSLLILVEPGTPKNFMLVRKLRQQLIELGATIAAPCPHAMDCPNNWCHFSARLERSRLHRQLKEGALGHEDEKFCYLIASKIPIQKCQSRILRHPLKASGHVRLSLCAKEGVLEEKVVARKDKELYRGARDAEWGDGWPMNLSK